MAPSPAHHHLTWGLPPVRVGWLLARARREAGLQTGEVAAAVGVSARTVRRWEAGASLPTDAQVRALAQLYRRPVASLLPERDPVQLNDHGPGLRVGGALVGMDLSLESNEQILRRYVAAVRDQRGLRDESSFVLRHDDVVALAAILDVDDLHLERDLMAIVGCTRRRAAALRAQLLRRRMAVPAVAAAMGLGGMAVAVTAPSAPGPASGAPASSDVEVRAAGARAGAPPDPSSATAPPMVASSTIPPEVAAAVASTPPATAADPAAPVVTAPVVTAPVDAAPVDAAPVDAAPVDAAPVDTAPVDTVTGDAVAIEAPLPAVPVPTLGSGHTGPGADHVGTTPPQILLGDPVVVERDPSHP